MEKEKVIMAVKGVDGKVLLNHQVMCPKCEVPYIVEYSGGLHFDGGEVWDDIEEKVVCPMCGIERPEEPIEMTIEDFKVPF